MTLRSLRLGEGTELCISLFWEASVMKEYKAYYNSPIGLIEITGALDSLASLSFVEEKSSEFESNNYLQKCITQIDEYFQGKRMEFDLKLAPEGTDFQKKVWDELIKIKYGNTLSYNKLSLLLGDKNAVRAVANANARNEIAIIIPCHRVIGSDGSLTGYAGGLWRKKWLLEHERKFSNAETQLGLF